MAPERRYGLRPGPAIARPFLDDLNPEQRAAVLSDAARLLILAGAGTGKTRTLTARVARLVGDGVHPEAIILLTFSRRAAAMMVERLQALLGDQARRVRAGTFHALAYRALTEAHRARPTILDQADQEELLQQARLLSGVEVPLSAAGLAEIHSHAINAGISIGDALLARAPEAVRHEEAVTAILSVYQATKAEMGLFDYDDLLLGWRALLDAPEGQAQHARTRHVLVDEYQDTNPLQAELAERLSAGKHLAIVGDDAQSIYGFRGARFELILDFPRKAPTDVTQLTLNYRSDPAILAVANRVIADNPMQFPKALRADRPGRLLPAWVPAKDTAEEARFVAQRALELVGEGVPLSEQAVLFRAHSHAVELELELTRRAVPYVVRAGIRFFEQAHVRDLLAYLRILVNPRDGLAWARALRMIPGIGAKTAATALRALSEGEDVAAALAGLPGSPGLREPARIGLAALARLIGPWLTAAPAPGEMIRRLLGPEDPVGLSAHVGAQTEGRRRRSELEQLAALADRESNLQTFLSELMLDQDVVGAADRPGVGTERLTLSTVHQAKGLEWRAVFMIGLNEGGFPAKSALFESGGEAEERRLFYVGVTRAMDQLYLLHSTTRLVGERETLILRPSRFLEALEAALTERWSLS